MDTGISADVDQYLGIAALLIVTFLVLSAAVETILESFRGVLGQFIPALKGAVSLDDALKQARDFAPPGGELEAKLSAIKIASNRVSADVSSFVARADGIVSSAQRAANLPPNQMVTVTEALNQAAEVISTRISDYERRRILVLRILSGVIGIGLCLWTGLDAFAELKAAGIELDPVVGQVLTGVAAASGSSYWHDQLDRIRSLKNVNQQLAAIIKR